MSLGFHKIVCTTALLNGVCYAHYIQLRKNTYIELVLLRHIHNCHVQSKGSFVKNRQCTNFFQLTMSGSLTLVVKITLLSEYPTYVVLGHINNNWVDVHAVKLSCHLFR